LVPVTTRKATMKFLIEACRKKMKSEPSWFTQIQPESEFMTGLALA
jgi:hypothetical protein